MIAILKKELWHFFGSWAGWIILAVFSTVSALYLFYFENSYNIFDIGTASLESYFMLAPWLLMFIIPAMSMGSIAQEHHAGTLQWLFSQPIGIKSFLAGKYLAIVLLAMLCLLPSLFYLYTIAELSMAQDQLDMGQTLGAYIGLFFLVAGFSALGILSSAMAKNQMMAFLLALLFNFVFYFGFHQLALFKLLGSADIWVQNIGFYLHYSTFAKGLVNSQDLCYFIFVSAAALYLAKYLVNKKRYF
jgi:ABC-2 type transport system permease protein